MAEEPRDPTHGGRSANDTSGWHRISGIGMEFVVAILGLGLLGWLTDRWLQTSPVLLLIGGGLGFATGLWMLIKEGRRTFHD